MNLIYNYLGLYRDGMGGINSHGIWLSFDLEGINKKVRPVYLLKLIAYIAETSKQSMKDVDTFKEPTDGEKHQDKSDSKRPR